jgi:raffinose/stachyose/melibiose transport system substrate-binding protein
MSRFNSIARAATHSISRRKVVQGGTAVAAGAALAGPLGRTATAQDSGWQGEITFYAQAYTPNSQLPNANQLTAFQDAADAYQAEHPGVTIRFIDEEFTDYLQTVRVKASGQELYDVFWVQGPQINGVLPKGIAVDLVPSFAEPNPYVEGNTAWSEVLNPTVQAYMTAPGGEIYVLNGDFVGTAFFYNVDLFNQAGITEAPTTWSEVMAAAQALSDAGITPFAGEYYLSWFGRHFWSDFYSGDYEMLTGCDGTPGQSPQDEAAAIKAGFLSTEDPRFLGWLPMWKAFTDLGSQEYSAQEPGIAAENIEADFATGKTAIMYSGSWIPRNLETIGIEFELGAFSFPKLTKEDIEFATDTDVSAVVGGPFAAYQYAVSTPESNKTMEEEGKTEAVLDFLRYIGTPEVVESVVNELGSFAPTLVGTTPNPGLETFAEQANQGLRVVNLGNSSASLNTNMQKHFGLYLSGNMDEDQVNQMLQTELDRAVTEFEQANPDIDITTCMGG